MLRRSQSLEECVVVSVDQMTRRKHAMIKRALTCNRIGRSCSEKGGDLKRWESDINKDKSPRCARQTPACAQKPKPLCRWDSSKNSKDESPSRWGSSTSKAAAESEPPKVPCKRLSFELPRAGRA